MCLIQNKKVTICACSSRSLIDKNKVAVIAARMKNVGYDVRITADLCRIVMQDSPDTADMVSGIILACYPRTIRSHLDRLGRKTEQITVDIRSQTLFEIFSQLGLECPNPEEDTLTEEAFRRMIDELPVETGVDAWYPVIDKTRCTECGKCHDFCLFGVYSVENRKIRVAQPQHCKNNCPACARMCPTKAIIFPKYEKSPVNGGTAQEETFNPEEMDGMYRERLRMRLQQRRTGIALIKEDI